MKMPCRLFLTLAIVGWIAGGARAEVASVYDNISLGELSAFFSRPVSEDTTFGDRLTLSSTGVLSTFSFTIVNSPEGGNTGSISAYTAHINMYRAVDNSSLWSFDANITNAQPNGPNSFQTIGLSGLEAFGVNLDTTDVLVTTRFSITSGDATQVGVGFFGGGQSVPGASSGPELYLSSNTTPAGYYLVDGGATTADPGYIIGVVVPEPGTYALMAVGLLPLAGMIAKHRKAT